MKETGMELSDVALLAVSDRDDGFNSHWFPCVTPTCPPPLPPLPPPRPPLYEPTEIPLLLL